VIEGIAVGLAAVLGVPAALAQDQGKPAGTGISVVVPTGKVSVSSQSVRGEPVFVRRTSAMGGMTIVEVSTTPFTPVASSAEQPAGAGRLISTSDAAQPASW